MSISKQCLRLLSYGAAIVTIAAPAMQAAAQTNLTARDRVLDFVMRTDPPAPIIATPDMTAPAVIPETEILDTPETAVSTAPLITAPVSMDSIAPEPMAEPAPDSTINTAEIIEEPAASTLSPQDIENSIVRDLSPAKSGPESFAFFTSARDYLAQRGTQPQPRLTLRYDVSRKNAKTAVLGPSSTTDIIIGPDYAAISKTADSLIIYDFKEKRLLNLSKTANSFSNVSLYAAAYRALDTVAKMTDGGKKRTIPLGTGASLDAVYLESSLGYAQNSALAGLSITSGEDGISADYNSDSLFSAVLNGPEFDSRRQAYSFISLLYHSEPVHPAVLAEMKDITSAPSTMSFRSAGPKMPDGEIITWTLKSKMVETAGFPLPASAASATQSASVSPIDFVMAEAVAGRALGGQVDPDAALTVINTQIADGNLLSAWISAQSLEDRVGGCERVTGLCRALTQAGRANEDTPELTALIDAMSRLQNSSTRLQGVAEMKAMIEAADAPSLILRRAGLALAKSSLAQREAAGLTDLDPAALLSQAIARNPYDLLAYQGLAQVKAARGDFSKSWDINDALRALDDVPGALRGPIDRAESGLERRAPGFFPPVGR